MKRKVSKVDFKESSLPSNRIELFKDILKNNYRILMIIGSIIFLFSIPLIFISLIKEYSILTIYNQLKDGIITTEEYLSLKTINDLIYDLINIISFIILGIGISGIIKIIKRLCFLDPIFFKDDFKEGIKDNSKQMCLLFAIFGIIILICNLSNNYSTNLLINYIPYLVTFIIIIPTFLIMMCAISIYKLNFIEGIYKSFLIYLKYALKTFLIYLLCITPIALIFINRLIIKYIVIIFIILILLPIILVLLFDYFCGLFDSCININQYPEIYQKGLYKKDSTK